MIQKGDHIRILPNLQEELNKLGFHPAEARAFAARFAGTIQIVYDVWHETDEQTYVTVELCCEVPIQCCEPVQG